MIRIQSSIRINVIIISRHLPPYHITSILFDEKIYGSNHLTLGKDYEIAPNGNSSNIHWDLVCIGADVYLDGELIRKGREFVTEDLKGLNPENLLS